MARKRVVEPSGVKTWEDANDALRQIAEAQLALADIEGEMNKQILGAKKAAEEQSKPYKDRVAKLERELKDFVTEHRADMGKTKTRALTFGEVGFRLSTSVSLPRAKEKIEEIIRRLKTRQMMDCIVVKEDVSKEALKKYGEDTVNAVGATWKQQDVFGYDRYVKTTAQGATKALKVFLFDNVVEESRASLEANLEEFPALALSIGEKLLGMLGLSKQTNLKML